MILGHVRDRFSRVTLQLPVLQGPRDIEFILDRSLAGAALKLKPAEH